MGALPLGPDISLLSLLFTTSAEYTSSLALMSKLCGGKEGHGALCCIFSWKDLCFLLVRLVLEQIRTIKGDSAGKTIPFETSSVMVQGRA